MISIKELDKAEVLAGLYNGSRPQGMGFLYYNTKPMTVEEARLLLSSSKYFDYLYGRVMKLDFTNDDEIDDRLYDRDNGEGAASMVIKAIREKKPQLIQRLHEHGVKRAIEDFKK